MEVTALIRRSLVPLVVWALIVACGCAQGQRSDAPIFETTLSDPIGGMFSHCADLFLETSRKSTCEFTEIRGRRGLDEVEERVRCVRGEVDVACEAYPAIGPGPESFFLKFRCSRDRQKCTLTGGNPEYMAYYAHYFDAYKPSRAIFPQNESRIPAERR
jgi:hypothetical protein